MKKKTRIAPGLFLIELHCHQCLVEFPRGLDAGESSHLDVASALGDRHAVLYAPVLEGLPGDGYAETIVVVTLGLQDKESSSCLCHGSVLSVRMSTPDAV